MARKNTTDFADIPISPLTGQMDLRSPSGSVPFGDFRVVLNASMNELRKRCRRVGFRKLGFNSPQGFNNQDLHDQLLAADGCGGNAEGCQNAGTISADPPSGSYVLAGTYVVLSNTNPDAHIFYNVGSGDVLYEEPFQLPIGVTTVTAFAVVGEEECPDSAVTFTYHYSDEIIDFVEFHLLCNSADQAGVFFEFEPNGVHNDYVWELSFSKSESFDSKRLEIYETSPTGLWSTGQAWATDNPIFPEERGGAPFAVYPLVIIENETQLNTEYTANVAPGLSAGGHQWHLYGQPFVANVGYFKLIWTVVVDGEESQLVIIHPNVCDCGYYEDGCCDYDYEYGCYDVDPESSAILNIAFQQSGDTVKTGPAAVGELNDFWNTFNFNPSGTPSGLTDPDFADGSPSTMKVSEITSESASQSIFDLGGTSPTYEELFANAARVRSNPNTKFIRISAIPTGTYSIYVYTLGQTDLTESLDCRVTSSMQTSDYKTAVGTGDPDFIEGDNYVVFDNFSSLPGSNYFDIEFRASQLSYITGIQLVKTV